MRVYLDACCLNRPFDDQAQDRVRIEAEAVEILLQRVREGRLTLIASEALTLEIDKSPDPERTEQIEDWLQLATQRITIRSAEVSRAAQLEAFGFGAYDALHLACAESAGVNVFFTTDDKLLRRAQRYKNQLRVRVTNPAAWLSESNGEQP